MLHVVQLRCGAGGQRPVFIICREKRDAAVVSAKPNLVGLLCVGAALIVVFAVIGWQRRAGDGVERLEDPRSVLEQYREAVLHGDRAALERYLTSSLRSEATRLLTSAQRRGAPSISWVVIESDRQGDLSWFEVHETARDGWIYPVRYGLKRQGGGWKIARVAELQPQRAPIAPGTHIREVLAQDSQMATNHRENNESTSLQDAGPEESVP